MNDADQERAWTILPSHNLIPSVPDHDDISTLSPASFASWRQEASAYRYRDRRRLRSCASIYEIPTQSPDSNSEDSILPPLVFTPCIFIILYSTEFVGLPPLPALTSYSKSLFLSVDDSLESPYVPLSALLRQTNVFKEDIYIDFAGCLVPTFARLLESEMYVLLQQTSLHSATWGQHMAQLSALIYSRSCPGGPDNLPAIVAPRFREFAKWIQSDLKGEEDHSALKHLQENFM